MGTVDIRAAHHEARATGRRFWAAVTALLAAIAFVLGAAASDAAAKRTLNMLFLGDSYSAGVGVGAWVAPFLPYPFGCDRDDDHAYGPAAAKRYLAPTYTVKTARLIACSGHTTWMLERHQLQDVKTTHNAVALTIGGNNIYFGDKVQGCSGPGECGPDVMGVEAGYNEDSQTWKDVERALKETYVKIRQKMNPYGHMYVLKYPIPFSRHKSDCEHLNSQEQRAANATVVRLNEAIATAVNLANNALPRDPDFRRARPGNIHLVTWDLEARYGTTYTVPEPYPNAGRVFPSATTPNGLCNNAGRRSFVQGYLYGPQDWYNSFHPDSNSYDVAAVNLVNSISRHQPSTSGGSLTSSGGGSSVGGGLTALTNFEGKARAKAILATKLVKPNPASGWDEGYKQLQAWAKGTPRSHTINGVKRECTIGGGLLAGLYHAVVVERLAVVINSLNRWCNQNVIGAGTKSHHYINKGIGAIDIGSVNGKKSTGSTANDRRFYKAFAAGAAAYSKGSDVWLGQHNCRQGAPLTGLPAGVNPLHDACNHLHVYSKAVVGASFGGFTPLTPVSTPEPPRRTKTVDVNGDGNTDVLWFTGLASGAATFTGWQVARGTANALSTWVAAKTSVVRPSTEDLRVGDFDGDGKTDVLWFTGATSGTYPGWQLAKGGEGGLSTWKHVKVSPVKPSTSDLRVGDFDGDGITDVLWFTGQTSGTYPGWQLAKGGAGGLSTWKHVKVSPVKPSTSDLRTGDFDGDGKTDVLWFTGQTSGTYPGWQLAKGGAGAMSTWKHVKVSPVKPSTSDLRVGDFDGDGITDVLWFTGQTSGTYPGWQLAKGGPSAMSTWKHVKVSSVYPSTSDLRTGDFDGDGKTDVLWFTGQTSGTYPGWQLAKGGAGAMSTWKHVKVSPVKPSTSDLRTGDFDGDGKTDVLWFTGASSGTFPGWQLAKGGAGAMSTWKHVKVSSVKPSTSDLITGALSDEPADLEPVRTPTPTATPTPTPTASPTPTATPTPPPLPDYKAKQTTVDFNGDGRTDVLWLTGASSGTYAGWQIAFGSAGGAVTWTPSTATALKTSTADLRTGDFNGDGRTDILWFTGASSGSYTGWQIAYGTQTGLSGWTQASDSLVKPSKADIRFGDFNGDGKTDVLWFTGAGSGTVYGWQVAYGAPSGLTPLIRASNSARTPSDSDLRIADFDGDGRSDVLWFTGASSGTYTGWQAGWGTATGIDAWHHVHTSTLKPSTAELSVADFDGDGKADVLWFTRASTGTHYGWQLASALAPFKRVSSSVRAPSESDLRTGDFDGDGKTDVLWLTGASTGTYPGWQAAWATTGTFDAWNLAFESAIKPSTTPLGVGDYNGDGRADVIRFTGTGWHLAHSGPNRTFSAWKVATANILPANADLITGAPSE